MIKGCGIIRDFKMNKLQDKTSQTHAGITFQAKINLPERRKLKIKK